jgi:circadian clock protein KaiC
MEVCFMDEARAATGIAGLDDVLCGGFVPGHVHIVEGNAGTGKTTLALQFLLAGIARDESSLYVTLSESAGELRAAASSHGWNLGSLAIHELVGEAALDPSAEQSVLRPSELELGETVRAVMHQVIERHPARVVFDSLSDMRLLAQDPLRYRRQMLALKQFLVAQGCTTLLLDDQSAGGDGVQLHSLANSVVALEQVGQEFGTERRRLRVAKVRGSTFRSGWHDYVIVTGGIRVFPRLIAAEHRTAFLSAPMTTGLPRLDALLGGGLVPGTNLLVTGPAGAGKTLLATRCLLSLLEAGKTGAMFLFDEGRSTLLARCRALGLDLQPWLDQGALTLHRVDPAELSPGEFIATVRDVVERDGARALVFDSLDGFMQAMPGERFLLLQLHELLSYLNQQGCLTLLVLGLRGAAGEVAAVDVSYLADSVLLLRYFVAGSEMRRAIQATKTRMLPHEHGVRELRIGGDEGLDLSEPFRDPGALLLGVPGLEEA